MLIRFLRNTICIRLRHSSTFSEINSESPSYLCTPVVQCETKILKVAIIGLPNAGKSTFINNLMDRRVCAASQKVHTTRIKAAAVFTEGDSQIVFVDTPGLVNDKEKKKFNLSSAFVRESKKVTKNADIIGVIHDSTDIWNRERLDIKAIKLLELQEGKPSFLVLNKVDALKSKRKLLDLARQLTDNHIDGKVILGSKPVPKSEDEETRGWKYFEQIFMVSALTGDGMKEVKDYLIQKAKPGEWLFPADTWTDQSDQTIVENTVKAALLDYLPQEMPYEMKVDMEYFRRLDDGSIVTRIIVKCPTERKATICAGHGDSRLREINEKVQRDLQETFYTYVNSHLIIVS